VRVFGTISPEPHAPVGSLVTSLVDTVAMASTGVYATPIFGLMGPDGMHRLSDRLRQCSRVVGATRRALLARIVGVDLVVVAGISASVARRILSEGGTDMRQFPTVKPCCSWLGLAAHHGISGRRISAQAA
jgi:hypothetical protein